MYCQWWFTCTGAAVMASGTGSFAAVMEITDSIRQSRKMDYAFLLAVFWIMLLVIPHTTAVVLAYPHQALTQGDGHLLACMIPLLELQSVGVPFLTHHGMHAMGYCCQQPCVLQVTFTPSFRPAAGGQRQSTSCSSTMLQLSPYMSKCAS